MTKSNNQIIHKARGICLHECYYDADLGWLCDKCETAFAQDQYVPDYFTDHAEYLKALLEFKEKDWWDDFAYKRVRKHWGINNARFWEGLLDPAIGTPILAKYLRGG